MPVGSGSSENPLPGCTLQIYYILIWWKAESSGSKLSSDSYKGTNPIYKGFTLKSRSNPNYLPRHHFLIPSCCGVEFQHMTFEGDTKIQSLTARLLDTLSEKGSQEISVILNEWEQNEWREGLLQVSVWVFSTYRWLCRVDGDMDEGVYENIGRKWKKRWKENIFLWSPMKILPF